MKPAVSRILWFGIGASLILLSSFQGEVIVLSAHRFTPTAERWSWWGLSRQRTELFWRQGEWMAKDNSGNWYVAVAESDDDGGPMPP